MPFAIDRVVPWGRTLAEYRGMFALTDADLRRRIVGCGDGPASFNAELTARRGRVVSIDPLYAASARAIGRRVEETFEVVMGEVRRNRDDFVWTHVPSIEELGWRRLAAMRRFLSDYGAGAKAGRYVAASLPALPFGDGAVATGCCACAADSEALAPFFAEPARQSSARRLRGGT